MRYTRALEAVLSLLTRRITERARLAWLSDRAFVETAYREVLGRAADQDGLDYHVKLLREGHSRIAVLVGLARSEEFQAKLPQGQPPPLPDLRLLRPGQYHEQRDLQGGPPVPVFDARDAADFDWLESMILSHGYYERPGVWNFQIDTDKRVMAEILSGFAPRRGLELGAASGAVLRCLHDLGVVCEGVEISALAATRAFPEVRARIHTGDLLDLKLPGPYDLVFGLDVFEHLNPNRLDATLREVARLLTPGGFMFANIPAFGSDPVFGPVFPLYLDGWEQDAAAGRHFNRLHVDERGYPLHGHLIGADWRWWQRRFEQHGLVRQPAVERALHAKYDHYMQLRSPARAAYFVFSRGPRASDDVVQRVAGSASAALANRID